MTRYFRVVVVNWYHHFTLEQSLELLKAKLYQILCNARKKQHVIVQIATCFHITTVQNRTKVLFYSISRFCNIDALDSLLNATTRQ